MRKIELLQLHSLLRVAREDVEADEDIDEGAFDGYESLDMSPFAIHRPKERHREAVLVLARELAAASVRQSEHGGIEADPPEG